MKGVLNMRTEERYRLRLLTEVHVLPQCGVYSTQIGLDQATFPSL